MKRALLTPFLMLAVSAACLAQVGGGAAAYGQANGSGAAEQNERAKRNIPAGDKPPSATSMFLDASVLMNVKADEYVAVFGISQEGATLDECRQKMDATVRQFSDELKGLGIGTADVYVDFVAQNKIYGYEVAGDVAKEKLTGFEVKKNISMHYKDKSLLDKLIAAASRAQIFDLIKVDYIVKDLATVQNRLMEEASRVIRRKATNHERLLGIKLRQPAQVYAEKNAAYFPTEMYDSYTAFESEDVSTAYYRQKFTVQGTRKNRTFYFNALSSKSFDHVVNPVVTEPVVQFTLYLKVKFETGQGKPSAHVKSRSPKAKK